MGKGMASGEGYNIESYNNEAFDAFNEKALVPCNNCGRTFLPDSLIRHQKGCSGSNSAGGVESKRRSNSIKIPDNKRTQLGKAGA